MIKLRAKQKYFLSRGNYKASFVGEPWKKYKKLKKLSTSNLYAHFVVILQSRVYCTIFQSLAHWVVMPDGWDSSEWFNHHHTLCMVSKGGYSKFYLDGCKSEGCIYAIMGPLDTKSEIGAISSVYNSQNSKSSHSAMPINML